MNLQDSITTISAGYDLPVKLVAAVARVESNMGGLAIRFEPGYRWLWDMQNNKPFRHLSDEERYSTRAPRDFYAGSIDLTGYYSSDDTEWVGQRTSWGPFQMMGAVLREAGYFGPFTALCFDMETATRFACAKLSHLRDKYFDKHGWSGVVAAYNAGRPRRDELGRLVNQDYVNKISKAGAGDLVQVG